MLGDGVHRLWDSKQTGLTGDAIGLKIGWSETAVHVAVWVRDSRTLGEVLGVLNALRHTSVELLGVLLANSGLRNSDVVGLKWCDSNFEKPALLVDSLIREI